MSTEREATAARWAAYQMQDLGQEPYPCDVREDLATSARWAMYQAQDLGLVPYPCDEIPGV